MQKLVADYQKFVTVEQQLATIQNKNTTAVNNENLAREKLLNNMSQYMAKYKDTLKNTPKLAAELKQLFDDTEAGKYENQPVQVKTKFEELQIAIRAAGGETETLLQKGARVVKEKLGFGLAASAAMYLRQAVKQVISTVIELDKAVVDLQIATGYTREETQQLVREYSDLARELGTTTTEVAQAADTWLRQGYSIEEANELITQSTMLAKLGQMDAADASTALTSALKGYQLEASQASLITDKMVAVDMEAAASAGDIATAMAECANSARIAGVDMDTLIGYLTTVKQVTQDGAESVGTFAKTLFARMGNIKAGNLVDPTTSEDLSDVEATLSGVGIALRSSNDTFRDFDDVLAEVAGNWSNYSNVQQHAIAVAFAGTRQQEKFLVLMENFDEAMELAGVSTNSAGTALDKYSNSYLPSVEAATNSLKASTEEFSQSLADSDVIAFFIKLGDILVQGATALNDWDVLLPLVTAGLMAYKNVGKLNNQNMPAYAQLRLVA